MEALLFPDLFFKSGKKVQPLREYEAEILKLEKYTNSVNLNTYLNIQIVNSARSL